MSVGAMIGCAALFAIYFIVLRLPQFLADWDGQDANGQCAAMMLGWAAPTDLVFSRIGGKLYFNTDFPHPLAPYMFFAAFGTAIRSIIPFDTLHGQSLIFALKGAVSLLQLSVWLALLFLAFRYARTRVAIVWLWAMAAAPLALYAANEVQPDSSPGLLFTALFFISILVVEMSAPRPIARTAWLMAGGVAAGLGKNEWSFCLAVALVATSLAVPMIELVPAWKTETDRSKAWAAAARSILPVAIGLVCGNLVSYWLGPVNYVGGWDLLRGAMSQHSILSGDTATWLARVREAAPFIFFHVIVDISIFVWLIRRPQIYSPTLLLAVMFANALFVSYLFNSWSGFPRYFAPAFIALGICFLLVIMRLPPKDARSWSVAATIVLVVLQSAHYQVKYRHWALWRGNRDIPAWIAKSANDPNHCVLVLDYSFVLDRNDIDFVHAPNGQPAIDRYLANIGRAACPPLGS